MTERPSQGEQIAGIAGLALFLIMFLFAWYSWPNAGGTALNGLDAFDAYSDWLDMILMLAAFSGIALALFGPEMDRLPISLSIVATVLGGLSAILILIFIISTPNPPDFGAGAGFVEGSLGVEPGAWLGLISAIALTAGGYLTMQEEGVSFGAAADRLSRPGGGGGGHEHPYQQPPAAPPQQPYSEQPPAQQPYPPQGDPQAPPPPAPEQPPYQAPPPPPPQQPPPGA